MDPSSLHCPNCGAAADPDAGRCPYCQARLATVSCPECFARLFDGAAFCPHCGARRTRSETTDTAVPCPGCKQPLTAVTIGDTPLLECRQCDGIWIEAALFERLCSDKSAQAAVLHRVNQRPVSPDRKVTYRPCPRCGKMMNRVNFARMSGTVVDVCRAHGTFLDAGELHRILTFIQGGGLERARASELEELKAERRRLEAAEQALRMAALRRGSAEGGASGSLGTGLWDSVFGD